MRFLRNSWLFTAAISCMSISVQAVDSPYAGQEKRVIKALTEQEISDYKNGRGMGTSKAAELNHYPGPAHVLDAASKLQLSADQTAKTQQIHKEMTAQASLLGEKIVQKETELETLFARKIATPENLQRAVKELAQLQADFRFVHLTAHLSMRAVLSESQIAAYDRLRGYGSPSASGKQHSHH